MKVWNYEFEDSVISVTREGDTAVLQVNDGDSISSKVLSGYVTLNGHLNNGQSVYASVGDAIPNGCKVVIHGKSLVAS